MQETASPLVNPSLNQARKLVVLLGAFLFIVLFVIGGVGFVLFRTISDEKGASPLTEEDLSLINRGITFTDAGDENFEYKSPTLNFQVTIDTLKFSYSETTSGISITPKKYDYENSIYTSIRVTQPFSDSTTFELKKEAESFKRFIKTYEQGKITSEEEITVDGVPAVKMTYSRLSFGGSTQLGIVVITVRDNWVYEIQYKFDGKADFTGRELDNLLGSFKFIDSSEIDASTTFASTIWGYEFKYDSKLWTLDGGFNSRNVTLNPRGFGLEDSEKVYVTVNSTDLSRTELIGKEFTYLDEAVDERIGSLASFTSSYPGFEVTKRERTEIDGKTAILVEYQIKPGEFSFYHKFFKEYSFLHYNAITRITLNYSSTDSTAYKAAEDFLESFKLNEPTTGFVKGIDSETISEEKAVLRAKPGVARIFANSCGEFALPKTTELPTASGKTYKFCSAGFGSGFFINKDGYVATNGHVVVFDDRLVVFNSVRSGFTLDLLLSAYVDLYAQGETLTQEEIIEKLRANPQLLQDIAIGITEIFVESGADLNSEQNYYVQKGEEPFVLNSDFTLANASAHLSSELIDYDYDPLDNPEAERASDVAILKVEPGDYPVLSLSNIDEVNIGSPLLIIGFPGAATEVDLLSVNSRGIETVTRGIVSAFKETSGGRVLIQTDASIHSGNSGGPGIDRQSQVLGIASLGVTSSGAADFNFLRDVNDLKDLMQKNSIDNTIGETETYWREGVDLFFDSHFSAAIKKLEQARGSYPALVETENLIEVAKTKVSLGLDVPVGSGGNSILDNLTDTEKILFVTVICLTGFVLVLLLGVIVIFIRLSRKTPVPTQPINPPFVQTPPQPPVNQQTGSIYQNGQG